MIRPNAPKLITLIAAAVLTIVGIHVVVHPIGIVHDILKSADIKLTRDQGRWCLIGSPLLLVAGSLLPGL